MDFKICTAHQTLLGDQVSE